MPRPDPCREVAQRLDRWFELSAGERAALEEHGEGCPDCRQCIHRTRALFAALEPARRAYRELRHPGGEAPTLAEERDGGAPAGAGRLSRPQRPAWLPAAVAAVLLLATVFGSWWLLRGDGERSARQEAVPEREAAERPAGERTAGERTAGERTTVPPADTDRTARAAPEPPAPPSPDLPAAPATAVADVAADPAADPAPPTPTLRTPSPPPRPDGLAFRLPPRPRRSATLPTFPPPPLAPRAGEDRS